MPLNQEPPAERVAPTASGRLSDGTLIELVHDSEQRRTAFAVWRDGAVSTESSFLTPAGERLVPIPASNNLIRHKALLLPEKPDSCASTGELVAAIKEYLRRYVD